jgi:nitroreductase
MDVKSAIEARRAYRSLVQCEITDEMIDDLAKCAGLAPSCFNKQPWNYVFVREPKALQELAQSLKKGNEWAQRSSLIIAVFSKVDQDCALKDGREYFLFDCGLSVSMIVLRATELGLVAHPIAGFDSARAKKALGIPEEMTLITLVMVGAKAEQPSDILSEDQAKGELERPPRQARVEFVHLDHYHKGEAE